MIRATCKRCNCTFFFPNAHETGRAWCPSCGNSEIVDPPLLSGEELLKISLDHIEFIDESEKTIVAERYDACLGDDKLDDCLGALVDAWEEDLRDQWKKWTDTWDDEDRESWRTDKDPNAERVTERVEQYAEVLLTYVGALVNVDGPIPTESIRGPIAQYEEDIRKEASDILMESLSGGSGIDHKEWSKKLEGIYSKRKRDFDSRGWIERFKPYEPLLMVCDILSILMASESVRMLSHAVDRTIDLWGLLVDASPGKATAEFLQRVSRAYIWGFDAECVILCRSALDTLLRERISDDLCRKQAEDTVGLKPRVWTAFKENMIDEPTRKAALRVVERGSKNVHDSPEATKDILGTIKDALAVVRQIAAPETGA